VRSLVDGAPASRSTPCASDRWTDPLIVALNPSAVLPSQPITVVLQVEARALTSVFTRACSRSDALFAATIGESSKPAWPTGAYRSYAWASHLDGVASMVLNRPYSIGMSSTGECID
jgi:hypothetical protein